MLEVILSIYVIANALLFFFLINLVRLHHGWIRRVDKDIDYFCGENRNKIRELEKYLGIDYKQGYEKEK